MSVAEPSDGPTGLGSMTFQQLGDVSVTQAGDDVTVTGTLNNVEWPEFSSDEGDRTGYYLAVLLTGTEGAYVAAATPRNVRKVVALADCADGYVKALKPGQRGFTLTAYPSESAATSNVGGTRYYFDLSGVEYAE